MPNDQQRGYTLVEALIAAAIAAFVIAGISQSLRASAQAQGRLAEARAFANDAESVMALARARMPAEAIRQAYPHLIIEYEAVPLTVPADLGEWRPLLLTVRDPDRPSLNVETIVIAQEAGQ